jgi:hypothetical protein
MAHDHLAIYLNDHLAGASGLLEMLEHIAAAYAGTDAGVLARTLHAEVSEDRHELEQLMASLEIGQSLPRRATGWISEKLARLKLRLDDKGGGQLHLLEAMEAVSIGIEGKRLLWISLDTSSKPGTPLGGLDFARLIKRAEDQRARVEDQRRKSAAAAFAAAG